jgi:hypothetical protein
MGGQGKHGLCKLCGRLSKLCCSHIVPEFCHKQVYDNKHRGLSANVRGKGGPPVRYIQQGYREHLLCASCENHISRYEHNFQQFWYGPNGLPAKVDPKRQFEILRGANYAPFKLFHLSVLWRASVSVFCKGVDLGPYEPKIREMLLRNDPKGPAHFPLYGLILIDADGTVNHGVVTSPCQYKRHPARAYCACYCGCEWHIVVTDHPTADERTFAETSLSMDGQMILVSEDWRKVRSVDATIRAFYRRNK